MPKLVVLINCFCDFELRLSSVVKDRCAESPPPLLRVSRSAGWARRWLSQRHNSDFLNPEAMLFKAAALKTCEHKCI